MDISNATLQLHTFFRSTSTARVRTAANIKNIPLSFVYVNVRKSEQFDKDFARLNPNCTVPVLTITPKNKPGFSITQSIPILEFFEEAFPGRTPLLPPPTDLPGRAHVRDLVNIIACDIQPPTNRRILLRIQEAGGSLEAWAFKIMNEGLMAFEALAKPFASKYSYGDSLTMADVVLAPTVENAVRYGVDLEGLPTVKRVFERIREDEAFREADWRHQADTPADEVRK